ncbi:MAG: murein biosynthesis integral membrane protein MurJ [Candidatus Magasanikbacteria bacterium]
MIWKKIFNHSSSSITGGAIIIAGTSLLNKFIGLARDRILAHYFGAGPTMDAYYAAFKIPDLIYNLIVVGALTAGFIPVFTRLYHRGEDKSSAWDLANNILNIFGVLLLFFALIGMIFAPQVAHLVAPGFDTTATALTARFIRLMFWSPVLLGLSMVIGGILQSLRRFVLYALAPIFYNLGIIFGALVLVPALGLIGLPIGVILGAFLHLALQMLGARSAGWRWGWKFNWRDIDTRIIGRLMIPRTLGLAISNVNSVIITILASTLAVGSVATYSFADNLQWVPIGVIGIPFALAAFPALSAAAGKKNMNDFVGSLAGTARQILFLIIPLSIIFLVLRAQIVRVILGSGEFDWTATINTADTLAFFSIGMFAQALNPLMTRAFFALENTKTPFFISVTAEIAAIASAIFFKNHLGVAGLALGVAIGAVINFILLTIFLFRITKNLEITETIRSLLKILVAAAPMAITIQLLKYPLAKLFDLHYFWGIFAQGAIAGITGLLVYCLICWGLQLPEFMDIKTAFQRRFLRIANIPAEIDGEIK